MAAPVDALMSATLSSPVRERVATAPLERGDLVGRYIVVDRLGEGAMGAVYAAYDPELDRRVALKLLHPEVAATAERVERLMREGRAMARLAHPDIVAVYDIGRHEERVFIVLELVEGTSLGQWLREAPRSREDVLRAFTHAGRGLAAAHAAGLVHRDFKPDNVLLGTDGRVRVADFGLARVAENDAPARSIDDVGPLDDASFGATGARVGTPAYMAPEQLAGGAADARSDQYAFCVALYEALYGRRPFHAATVSELASAVGREPASAPSSGDVPTWLRDLTLRGLRARPEERFPSMDALLSAIPVDPEADARASDGARALFVTVVITVLFFARLYTDPPGATQAPARLSGEQVAVWILGTLVAVTLVAVKFRRRLLANRISRQIFGSLVVIFYASVFGEYFGARLLASSATIDVFAFLWIGACLTLLGIALRPGFAALGAIPLVGAGLIVAYPEHVGVVDRVVPVLFAVALVLAWGFGPRYSAWREGRRP